MKKAILLSIIIPTYKRSENLIKAIESIKSNKNNYEIIVVDDNDKNSEYRKINENRLKKYIDNKKIIYIKHIKNMNGANARNTGISRAKGEYVTFLDDDDEFIENRISVLEEAIIKHEKPDFLYTGVIYKKNDVEVNRVGPIKITNKQLLIKLLLGQDSFVGTGSNLVCKKELIDKIGGFDGSFTRHQDIEFLIRYMEVSKKIIPIGKYLIVKNLDDTSNVPNINILLQIKKQFFTKFNYILKSYSNKEVKNILKRNYYDLLFLAFTSKNNEDIKKVIKVIKEEKIYNPFKIIYINYKSIILNMMQNSKK